MISYLMRHWRGRYHVAWALLVNGFLGYLAINLAWAIVSDSTPLNWSRQVLWANLAAFVVWFLWAAVGIFRSALRALREPSTWLTKAVAVLALIALSGFAYVHAVDTPDVIKGTPRLGGPIWIGKPRSVPWGLPPGSSVRSDLAFVFICERATIAHVEDGIEGFLKREGFRTLNQARIMRSQGASRFDILFFGLDDKHRIFNFISLPRRNVKYAVSLVTPPPTQRSPDLEDGVLKLVSEQLGCDVQRVTRHDNQADARVAFDAHYRQMEDLFEQGERLEGKR